MNVLKNFTIQNLKLNKKRTIVTIIGVLLSTALICAVSGMTTSTQKTFVKFAKETEGNYHVCFKNVPKDELKYIENNVNVDSYFITNNLGYTKLEGSKNENKPYLYIMEFNKEAIQNSGLQLTEGKMPENSNEIIISETILNNARVNFKIGDNITLNIGTRELSDGTKLTQEDPYNSENSNEEQIINTVTKTYKIVGIIKRPSYNIESYNAPGYTIISYMENTNNLTRANISVLYKNPRTTLENTTKQIITIIKQNTGEEIEKTTNEELLRYEGILNESSLKGLYEIASVVILIIVVSSVFVIRNSFAISVSEKTKQYGMMSSIGATKKQIKKSVLFEGLIIGLIGIPLGIILRNNCNFNIIIINKLFVK
jgi:putative ABC transport system permease protein